MADQEARRLAGKVAIVTGSGQGIGRAEANLMAQEGAQVVVCDVGVDDGVPRAEKVAAAINTNGGDAIAVTEDLGTFDGTRRLVEAGIAHFGGLHIVLNNAGWRAANAIQDITESDYDRVLNSHLKATFGMVKHAAPIFLEQGAGIILNTSSESGFGHPYNVAYAAAKEGITGLTRSVARELGPYGIRCNQIRPRAEGTQSPEFLTAFLKFQPQRQALGRFGLGSHGDVHRPSLPEHVAALAVWLCTDAAGTVNGRDFFVMGDEVGLWSEPDLIRNNIRAGGWTLDSLDQYVPAALIHGLENQYVGSIALVP